jgi:hypothetical protein
MGRRLAVHSTCVLVAVFAIAACGGSGSEGSVPDTFVNDISRTWFEEGKPKHTFNFIPESSGDVSTTAFTGNETAFDGDFDLEGRFTGRQISFSRVASPSQKTEGTFLDRNTMQLTTPTGEIRLTRPDPT